jgi:diguanylate cyclase (GGDEF)-like protein/putative nucleotidyltransferase with HDIG domain
MSIYSIPPLLSVIAYAILCIAVLRDVRTRVRALFGVYLIISLLYAFATFIALADFFPGQTRLWTSVFALGGVSATIALYHFVCAFTHKTDRLAVKLGYGMVAFILVPLAALGYIPESAQLVSGGLNVQYGAFLYLITGTASIFVGLSVFLLVRRLRALKDPLERSRVVYLLVGIMLFTLFCFREAIPPLPKFPLNQIGHFLNALVITYAILRYQLLDIKLVVKKGLVYSGVTVAITAMYILLLSLIHNFVSSWFSMLGIVSIVGSAVIMAWLFNPVRTAVQKGVDKLFYRQSYDYRQMVLSFATKMSHVLSLNELAEAMLRPIIGAVHASQASLLLSDGSSFTSRFAERLDAEEPVIPLKLRMESPIVTWLARENNALSQELIDVAPEFKGLWQADTTALNASEIELLCPMRNKGKLIGILALSKKHSGGSYSRDDIDLLMTLANGAAVVIENAQLYAEAKQRANTDELTGLFNHRCFHQRLDEEIARCLRFGEIFSLLILDLDLFKTYNDIRGHLEGDEILKLTSRQIKDSIRAVDIGFRYGGDEFAVILPHTPLDGAHKAAEKIRKRVEAAMDSKGVAITCSIGIASWPADGVMREDIIRAADTALYYAKQVGRNRTHLASEVALAEVLRMEAEPDSKKAILNTVYALAATVDAKDHHTYGHSKKVAKYATEIAEALGYPQERTGAISAAALLHDIGKIGISDQILAKPGPLSPEEWEPIHAHPDLSVAIVKHIDRLSSSLAAIQYHHERYDGTGYPTGLKGDNIPLDARILAVADAYDAMTSPRPYRSGKLTPKQALEELKRCAGKQFDPRIVDVFVRINEQLSSKKIPAKRSPVLSHKER